MLRLAADENFDGRILRGLLRVLPEVDLVRVQDTELAAAPDPEVLAWAAQEGRAVLTHDVGTMTAAAWDRVRSGLPMLGVIEVSTKEPIGRMIEEIQLLGLASQLEDVAGQVLFLPL